MVAVGALVVVDDTSPARWLIESIPRFDYDVGSLVSATFDAYARVLHPAHDGGEPVSWVEIARANHKIAHPLMQFTRLLGYESRYSPGYHAKLPGGFDEAPAVGKLPSDVAATLARILARHTGSTGDCWFAVWEGWGSLDDAFRGHPTFPLPMRNYHLAHGPIAAAAQSVGVQFFGHQSCSLWWPDDHAWCVATDIDLDSTYVGASEAAVEELLASRELEAVRIDVTAGITADSDPLNPIG